MNNIFRKITKITCTLALAAAVTAAAGCGHKEIKEAPSFQTSPNASSTPIGKPGSEEPSTTTTTHAPSTGSNTSITPLNDPSSTSGSPSSGNANQNGSSSTAGMSLKQPWMLATPPEFSVPDHNASLIIPVFLPMNTSRKQMIAANTL